VKKKDKSKMERKCKLAKLAMKETNCKIRECSDQNEYAIELYMEKQRWRRYKNTCENFIFLKIISISLKKKK
jgi:hypothetical protein